MFEGCSALEVVVIPDSITDIKNKAFYGCDKLEKIIYVGTMQQAENIILFGKNTMPNSLQIVCSPNLYKNVVKYMEYKSYEDHIEITGLKGLPDYIFNINIPAKIDNKPVTHIDRDAFYGCTSLRSITIPDSVTSIGERAFFGCSSLRSITIPDSVISIGDYAFSMCTSLRSITIPDSVTSIGENAFYGCMSYRSIIIPDSVTSIGRGAFCNGLSLSSITIPDSVTIIGDEAFKNTAYYNDESNWENDVLYIGNHLIEAKKNISGDYIIKNGTKTIAEGVFFGCNSLQSLTIPGSVKTIGKLFDKYKDYSENTSLKSVIIGYGTEVISNDAFNVCKALESITLPDSIKSIGREAFLSTALYNNESNWKNGVLYIGNHLIKAKTDISGDYSLKSETKSIAYGAFSGCKKLKSIIIPASLTSINNEAFRGCTSLQSIMMSDSVKSIGYSAFNGCSSLSTVDYIGTKEQWSQISIDKYNENLTSATINYNYAPSCDHENVAIFDAVAATCTQKGLTEGVMCTDCGEVIIAQTEIPEKGHSGDWITEKAATDDTEGLEIKKCTVCGEKFEERVIPKLNSNYMLGDINGDGKVTATDARIVLRISTKLENLEEQKVPTFEVADVNGDSKITATDARKILRVSTKLEEF